MDFVQLNQRKVRDSAEVNGKSTFRYEYIM